MKGGQPLAGRLLFEVVVGVLRLDSDRDPSGELAEIRLGSPDSPV
jgi:hypothetical protein